MMVPEASLRIGEVEGGPVVVVEGTPYRIVVVGGDRVVDLQLLDGPADVTGIVLERELGCVDADHHESLAGVFPGPGPQVGELA
jgi:hypothetical protein